jgi:hypothetical protein
LSLLEGDQPIQCPQPARVRHGEHPGAGDCVDRRPHCPGGELWQQRVVFAVKAPDEKAVTERAYENPVFVEDLVRNVALKLNEHPDVTWYKVEAENHESIHNHNAYACIERADPVQTCLTLADTANSPLVPSLST